METVIEKLERQKESLVQRAIQTEKELQLRIQQEKNTHEEDVERMTRDRVNQILFFNNYC